MNVSIWIGNLGAYNRGELVGEWFALPMEPEEMREKIAEILSPCDEEFFIADYEADFSISEWDSPYRLNELAMEMAEVDEDALYMVQTYYYSDMAAAVACVRDTEHMILSGIGSMRELAELLVDEHDYLGEIPSRLRGLLDWDAIIDRIETETQWKVDEGKKLAICLFD